MALTFTQLTALRHEPVPFTGNRLVAACRIAGVTQMDVSRATGFAPQYITDLVKGRYQNVRLDTARKFADYFGCAIEDLWPAREAVSAHESAP